MLPHREQVWVVQASLTSANNTPRAIALYSSCCLNIAQPASSDDLLMLVLAMADGFTFADEDRAVFAHDAG